MSRNSDFWISLALLAFTAVAAALTTQLPAQGTGRGAGPNFVPWLMVGGIGLSALILLARSWRRAACPHAPVNIRLLAQLGGFLVLMLAYAAAYEPVGFIGSSLAFFLLALLMLGERRLKYLLAVPPLVVLGVYLVFTEIMQVYMP